MNTEIRNRARQFIENESQFHLGFLPTEQSNRKTQNLDKTFMKESKDGVRMLLSVDRDIVPMAREVFESMAFKRLEASMSEAIASGKRIVFSGCGATGRLSILLESMWRKFFISLKCTEFATYEKIAGYEDSVMSIMTGGDYALVRSVESFEDYSEFGKQQVRELEIGEGDVLVAITEGGETSSVLGTVEESVSRGAHVFLLFNNPAEILCKHLERSKNAIKNPKVTILDLYCGPMAVTGSTRMQATTSELLVAGAALETALLRLIGRVFDGNPPGKFCQASPDYAAAFSSLLDDLEKNEAVSAIAECIEFEEEIYRKGGLITYYSDNTLLDIFTDTTERAPTFMLPPFKKTDDKDSKPSWAFVKNPLYGTVDAWENVLGRKPRCIYWTSGDYKTMGAANKIVDNPPVLTSEELMKYGIGNEPDESRLSRKGNAAIMIASISDVRGKNYDLFTESFKRLREPFGVKKIIAIGEKIDGDSISIPCSPEKSLLLLMERLAVKLTLNMISTGTMVRLGRVSGNWMSFVEMSNKKLIDRSVRLISELCGLDYENACLALFETLDELERSAPHPGGERISPVQHTIARLGKSPRKNLKTGE